MPFSHELLDTRLKSAFPTTVPIWTDCENYTRASEPSTLFFV